MKKLLVHTNAHVAESEASAARLAVQSFSSLTSQPDAHGEAFQLLAGGQRAGLVSSANRALRPCETPPGRREIASSTIRARELRSVDRADRLAKKKYGNGYVGLLPKTGAKGETES